MKRKNILRAALLALVLILFVLPAIGFALLRWVFLPPERLTPWVVRVANERIEGEVTCERVELTYFETYPHLGLRLEQGALLTPDTLLAFDRATIVLKPTDYLTKGTLTIRRIALDRLRFHGIVGSDGHANWEIYHPEEEETETSSATPLPPIDLQEVALQEGTITYRDSLQQTDIALGGLFLHLRGSLHGGENRLALEAGGSSTRFDSPSYRLANHLAWHFQGRLRLSDSFRKLAIERAELALNGIPFHAEGYLAANDSTQQLETDLALGLEVDDLSGLLAFVPADYFKGGVKGTATGRVALEGRIRGALGDSIFPAVDLRCRIDDGSYRVAGMKQGIDTLRMDLRMHLDREAPDSSFIRLDPLQVVGPFIAWEMQAEARDLLRNPALDARLRGEADFTKLGAAFLNPDTLLLEGTLQADLRTRFTLDDLLASRFGKVQAEGSLAIDRFRAYSRPLGLDTYLNGTHLALTEVQEENAYMGAKGLIRAQLQIDTLNLRYGETVDSNISRLTLTANTARRIDTTAVIPLTLRLQYEKLRTRLPDSAWISTTRTLLRGGIKASASDKKIPTLGAAITVDTLKYILIPQRTGIVLTEGTFGVEALPLRDAIRRYLAQQGVPPRPLPARPVDAALPAADSVDTSSRLLRRWEARGKIGFRRLRGFSRLFPLPFQMGQTELAYNTNRITLKEARLQLGKSDLTLTGEVSQIRRWLRGGKLKGTFDLRSDYLDCNQLLRAAHSGMLFAEQEEEDGSGRFDEDSLALHTTHTLTADTLATDTTNQLLLVPAFLDLTLHAHAQQIDFKDLQMKAVEGEVVVRDRSINLSELRMDSNIGRGNLTMAYTTKERTGATLGIDLDMHQILVERLIGLFPSIDTLVPMLRSFEGVVNCQMTATCRTDSTLSVLLPTVNASCFLSGRQMVLLDGETFAEISKTLMFKNKKRNLIDSIAVDLAIRENKIEVFPFLVEMDRYKVAVGGTQDLDMNFNYHISVLKSPVPFKLGIDIYGNMEDYKFKIVKCKYKDFLKPAKQMELEATRRNIRQRIREAVREQIREAAPELANSLPPAAHGQ